MLRLLIPFILGIVLQYNTGLTVSFITSVCIVLFLLLCFVCTYYPLYTCFSLRWIYGLILNCLIVFLAMGMTEKRMQAPSLTDHAGKGGFMVARVLESPAERDRSFRVLIEPVWVILGDSTIKTSGKAIGWFQKDSNSEMLRAGDRIVLPNTFREIRNAGNPFEFDYKRYLRMQGIVAENYLAGEQWFIDGRFRGRGLVRFSERISENLSGMLKDKGISGKELAVAGALLLGKRSGLDYDLRQTYAASGAMHILAVSGLHVGILYIFLHWIIGVLKKVRYYFLFSSIIILLLIWFYALLTGLSPSVTRSATMFSFLAVGRSLGRSTNIFNTLAASAFVQLLINPFIIFMAGFQLSYIAVTGIALYQPLIRSLAKFRYMLLNQIWRLITVSFSAQLLIFPLIIYYFNQFPNYFIVTNLFAVPLAMIILYTGLMFFFFSFIPVLSSFLAFLLNIALVCLNFLTHTISYLPFSNISDIFISIPSLIALYATILFLSLFLFLKKTRFLQYALAIAIAGFILRADHMIKSSGQHIFMIYNTRRYSLYNFISGRENIIISDNYEDIKLNSLPYVAEKPALYLNTGNVNHLYSGKFFNHYTEKAFSTFSVYGDFVEFKGFRIFFARDNEQLNYRPLKPVNTDLLVISSGYSGNISDIYKLVIPEIVVIDSSVGGFRREQLSAQCRETGLSYHDVNFSGAFKVNLE